MIRNDHEQTLVLLRRFLHPSVARGHMLATVSGLHRYCERGTLMRLIVCLCCFAVYNQATSPLTAAPIQAGSASSESGTAT